MAHDVKEPLLAQSISFVQSCTVYIDLLHTLDVQYTILKYSRRHEYSVLYVYYRYENTAR
jgi:hypothetical protein